MTFAEDLSSICGGKARLLSRWCGGGADTADGQNPAPPKRPWQDDSSVDSQQAMVSHGFRVVQDFVHLQYWGRFLADFFDFARGRGLSLLLRVLFFGIGFKGTAKESPPFFGLPNFLTQTHATEMRESPPPPRGSL